MKRYFITSTGTGVGKTYITACLIKQALAMNKTIAAYKPVISGWEDTSVEESDTGVLLKALGMARRQEAIDQISPWRYRAPLAPSMAARLEQKIVNMPAIIEHSRHVTNADKDVVLIEGVGGIMVPMTDKETVLDWIVAAGLPIILVVGSYLGTISHTLTAIEVLRSHGLAPVSIIVNETINETVWLADTQKEISLRTKAPVMAIERNSNGETLQTLLG